MLHKNAQLKIFASYKQLLEHYALIIYASGGTGWQLLSLHDSTNGGYGLTISSFADVLKNITTSVNHRIDVLFVSCAMGMIEVAYEISPYADYIVATEDCISREHLIERFYPASVGSQKQHKHEYRGVC